MRLRVLMSVAVVATSLGVLAGLRAQQQAAANDVEAVVSRFWQAVSQGDPKGAAACVHLPFMVAEVDPATDATPMVAVIDEAALQDIRPDEMGLTPGRMVTVMRGPALAYVTYDGTTKDDDTIYPMLTVVAKEEQGWRIITTTVPM